MLTDLLSIEQIEGAIGLIESRLALDVSGIAGPPTIVADLHYGRGQLLEMLGRRDDAYAAYLNVLRQDSTHVEGLNALGLFLLATGDRREARRLLRAAVRHGPAYAAAHANLAYLSMLDGELAGARKSYERAVELDPGSAIAHHGLSDLLGRLGDHDAAEQHRLLALRSRPVTIERYTGGGTPIRVLVLGTAQTGNVPTYGYFDSGVFLVAAIAVDYWQSDMPLPPHDVVFNVIGEGDLCGEQLAKAAAIVSRTNAPVVNHPAAVVASSRVANARRLGKLEGVVTARTSALSRTSLTAPTAPSMLEAAGFTFPLLVRSPGYHTGDHFVQVERPDALRAAIAELPGDDLLVIELVEVRDARNMFRKFRVMIVDGKLYPLHLAVSLIWKVHYFSADMLNSPEHRAEDAAFLNDMDAVLGAHTIAALERVRDTLALEYGGIDFAISTSGDIVVFEANASMIVPEPGPEAIWDYRRKPVARIHGAVRTMLIEYEQTGRQRASHPDARSEIPSNDQTHEVDEQIGGPLGLRP